MTREYAKKFKWFQSCREEIEKHIDNIYDEFENKKCENCKYYLNNIECPIDSYDFYPKGLGVSCNKWSNNND